MAPPTRVNPTLFDKLAGGVTLEGLVEDDLDGGREGLRVFALPNIERFNEEALRATVRRDLTWMLNTTHLAAVEDLSRYPHVQTSVLNFGVPDLAGKALTRRVVLQRAREIRAAVRAFEPRMDEATLVVEPTETPERPNAITYVIHGDVRSAVSALPVKFRTDVDNDTASVTVRD